MSTNGVPPVTIGGEQQCNISNLAINGQGFPSSSTPHSVVANTFTGEGVLADQAPSWIHGKFNDLRGIFFANSNSVATSNPPTESLVGNTFIGDGVLGDQAPNWILEKVKNLQATFSVNCNDGFRQVTHTFPVGINGDSLVRVATADATTTCGYFPPKELLAGNELTVNFPAGNGTASVIKEFTGHLGQFIPEHILNKFPEVPDGVIKCTDGITKVQAGFSPNGDINFQSGNIAQSYTCQLTTGADLSQGATGSSLVHIPDTPSFLSQAWTRMASAYDTALKAVWPSPETIQSVSNLGTNFSKGCLDYCNWAHQGIWSGATYVKVGACSTAESAYLGTVALGKGSLSFLAAHPLLCAAIVGGAIGLSINRYKAAQKKAQLYYNFSRYVVNQFRGTCPKSVNSKTIKNWIREVFFNNQALNPKMKTQINEIYQHILADLKKGVPYNWLTIQKQLDSKKARHSSGYMPMRDHVVQSNTLETPQSNASSMKKRSRNPS